MIRKVLEWVKSLKNKENEMIELMECQMCGNHPDPFKMRFSSGSSQIRCMHCGCSSVKFTWISMSQWADETGKATGNELIDMRNYARSMTSMDDLARKSWNEMNKMIARGKILDEPAPEYKPKTRRL